MTTEPTILVLEDEPDLRAMLTRGLREEGFAVRSAPTAAELLRMISEGARPDLLIVDIGLPDADGRDVVQTLRAHGIGSPVIFLTARDALPDRVSGFTAGGDDYLTKPFAFAELIVRLQALLRRAGVDGSIETDGFRLDPATFCISEGGQTVEVTPTEFRLLARLAASRGTVVRRRDLVLTAWPSGAVVHDNTLDVYVARLRRKLATLPGSHDLANHRGVGYSLR